VDVTKPLVTVEYDLKCKRVEQAYGYHNRKTTDAEQAFIDEWEKRTTEALKVKKGA
jgi:hypothetical protein